MFCLSQILFLLQKPSVPDKRGAWLGNLLMKQSRTSCVPVDTKGRCVARGWGVLSALCQHLTFVWCLLCAEQHVYVVTRGGRVHCHPISQMSKLSLRAVHQPTSSHQQTQDSDTDWLQRPHSAGVHLPPLPLPASWDPVSCILIGG